MKTFLFYLSLIGFSISIISCKDEDDKVVSKTPMQSSCLLISRLTEFSNNSWYQYDSKNRLIKDSTNFQSTNFFYDADDKLIYSIRPINQSRNNITLYRYDGNVLKESILFDVESIDSFIRESYDYEVDNMNRIISMIRYQYSGSTKTMNGKNTFEYNEIGDIAEQITYFSNGGTLAPSFKNVYEYSESQVDKTLNYILFQNILLNTNKKLLKRNNRFSYNASQNAFSTTPQITTTDIFLNKDKKPELRFNSSPNGVLTYRCN